MKLPLPTKRSAAASGVALGLAAPILDLIQKMQGLAPNMRDALFISVLSLLIFIPATLFVVGIDYWMQTMNKKGQGAVAIDRHVVMRVLCWFAGGAAAFAVFSLLQDLMKL